MKRPSRAQAFGEGRSGGWSRPLEPLGRHLRKHREARGITLKDIGRITKINLSYLNDLEEERFERLPAPIFAIGFLKQYAVCVGLDPEDVVLRYRLACRTEGGPLRDGSSEKLWGIRKRPFWIVAGFVCGLVLLWVLLRPDTERTGERVRSIRVPRSSSKEMKKEQLRKELHLTTEMPSGETVSSPNAPVRERTQSLGETEENHSGSRRSVSITLQALRNTWVQVIRDSKPPVQQLMKGGERLSFQAEKKIHLKIEDGNGVRIFYDGKVYEDLGKRGEVVHIVFPPSKS